MREQIQIKQFFVVRLLVTLLVAFLTGCASSELQLPVDKYPVLEGEVGPVSEHNPLQYPFSCTTEQAGLGQPIIDNHEEKGQPVYGRWLFFDYKKGYSQFCGAHTEVKYFYRNQQGSFLALDKAQALPDDVELIDDQGDKKPFVVRYERGVINRFIYGMTVLSEWPLHDNEQISTLWNKRLLMLFNGGIGIGHHQSGVVSLGMLGKEAEKSTDLISIFNPDMLRRGYAVVGSTGMGSDTSFNLPLLLQTAEMVKQQAVAIMGEPEYTIGFGASGGSIQQFFNARRNPDLLDGVIVSHMFPDLLTQINGVGDCELLQYYFDRSHSKTATPSGHWRSWENRGFVEGFNSINGIDSNFSVDDTGIPIMANAERGSSVCIDGWRGVTPLIFNPKLYLPFYDMHAVWLKEHPEVLDQTHWTHWDDAEEIYGLDEQGFANRTYDNEGVQYGLAALRKGELSVDAFLDLNARIGGWKAPAAMDYEYAPYYPYGALALDKVGLKDFVVGNIKLRGFGSFWRGTQNLITLLPDDRVSPKVKSIIGRDDKQSVWSHHNATVLVDEAISSKIAPRSVASSTALERAHKADMVFKGEWNTPTIALMVYLDDELDIHDARQPFIFRARMQQTGSDTDLFNVWGVTRSGDADADKAQLTFIAMSALDRMSEWLVQGDQPSLAEDRCWDEDYLQIAQGPNVWEGVEQKSADTADLGTCAQRFKLHGNPRTAAGWPFTSETLKCDLKPVSTAIKDGTYGETVFNAAQREYLERIFTNGVCSFAAQRSVVSH